MSSASVEPRPWSQRRWWIFVALVFGAQVGLIFWLSDKSVVRPRLPGSGPVLHLAGKATTELMALNNPTLFALPHREGFSGLAWLSISQPPVRSFDWSEDPRWLDIAVERLGAAFDRSLEPDDFTVPASPARPVPKLTIAPAGPAPAAPSRSRLRLEGGLAGRKLITPIDLPPQQHTDLLTESVVQLVVGSKGRPVFVPVLLLKSGSNAADDDALRMAAAARFAAAPGGEAGKSGDPMADLTWGRMIFEWATLPVPSTNAPAAKP